MNSRSRPLHWVRPDEPLPPPSAALKEPNGLIAAGVDLTADRLIEAYRQGIFPWFSEGQPVLWWSPDPRMVLFIERFKVSRSLAKTARRVRREETWRISLDSAFERVMKQCAAPRDAHHAGTWITAAMIDTYSELHRLGLAHSVEIWEGEELIGGLYGVSIGRMFFGESMFARQTDASKLALFALVKTLEQLKFRVIDCQQNTGHLASLGAMEIPRASFLEELSVLVRQPPPDWSSVEIGFPLA